MDDIDKKEDDKEKIPPQIISEYRKMLRREIYLSERDRGRLVRFDDRYTQGSKHEFLEDLIIAEHMHIALNKALNDLPDNEYEIISDCFFVADERFVKKDSGEPNYSALAKKYGVTRYIFIQKLKRILKKLKKLVVLYYDGF